MQDISNSNLSKQAVRPVSEKVLFTQRFAFCCRSQSAYWITCLIFIHLKFQGSSNYFFQCLIEFDTIQFYFRGERVLFIDLFIAYRCVVSSMNACNVLMYPPKRMCILSLHYCVLNCFWSLSNLFIFPYFSADCIIMWWHPCTPNRYF